MDPGSSVGKACNRKVAVLIPGHRQTQRMTGINWGTGVCDKLWDLMAEVAPRPRKSPLASSGVLRYPLGFKLITSTEKGHGVFFFWARKSCYIFVLFYSVVGCCCMLFVNLCCFDYSIYNISKDYAFQYFYGVTWVCFFSLKYTNNRYLDI